MGCLRRGDRRVSGLDAIKARAAAPATIYEMYSSPHHCVTALEESHADVMKLVALIEKIREEAEERATIYQATSDRLWEQIRARDPERNLGDAERYTAYAALARGSAHIIDKTIKEGLTQ